MPRLEAVYPISGENVAALPVKHLDAAVAFYGAVLGFTVLRLDATTAEVQRDNVRLGLVQADDHEPGKAGSLAFKVDDLDQMHRELEMNGAKPGVFGTDKWGGKKHRTFFVREDTNGYCYCFYCALPE
jgi:catechol 2,3-dioxygenase-like lactoylglutathione lyase family enzyme